MKDEKGLIKEVETKKKLHHMISGGNCPCLCSLSDELLSIIEKKDEEIRELKRMNVHAIQVSIDNVELEKQLSKISEEAYGLLQTYGDIQKVDICVGTMGTIIPDSIMDFLKKLSEGE